MLRDNFTSKLRKKRNYPPLDTKDLLRNLIGWRMVPNVNHKCFRDLRPRCLRDNRREPQRGDLFLCSRINCPRTSYHWLIHPSEHKTTWISLLKPRKHRKEFISRENKETRVWFWVEIDNVPLNIPKILRALSRGINETAPTPRIALFRCGVVRQRTGEERNECEVKKC